jgi:hemicentin
MDLPTEGGDDAAPAAVTRADGHVTALSSFLDSFRRLFVHVPEAEKAAMDALGHAVALHKAHCTLSLPVHAALLRAIHGTMGHRVAAWYAGQIDATCVMRGTLASEVRAGMVQLLAVVDGVCQKFPTSPVSAPSLHLLHVAIASPEVFMAALEVAERRLADCAHGPHATVTPALQRQLEAMYTDEPDPWVQARAALTLVWPALAEGPVFFFGLPAALKAARLLSLSRLHTHPRLLEAVRSALPVLLRAAASQDTLRDDLGPVVQLAYAAHAPHGEMYFHQALETGVAVLRYATQGRPGDPPLAFAVFGGPAGFHGHMVDVVVRAARNLKLASTVLTASEAVGALCDQFDGAAAMGMMASTFALDVARRIGLPESRHVARSRLLEALEFATAKHGRPDNALASTYFFCVLDLALKQASNQPTSASSAVSTFRFVWQRLVCGPRLAVSLLSPTASPEVAAAFSALCNLQDNVLDRLFAQECADVREAELLEVVSTNPQLLGGKQNVAALVHEIAPGVLAAMTQRLRQLKPRGVLLQLLQRYRVCDVSDVLRVHVRPSAELLGVGRLTDPSVVIRALLDASSTQGMFTPADVLSLETALLAMEACLGPQLPFVKHFYMGDLPDVPSLVKSHMAQRLGSCGALALADGSLARELAEVQATLLALTHKTRVPKGDLGFWARTLRAPDALQDLATVAAYFDANGMGSDRGGESGESGAVLSQSDRLSLLFRVARLYQVVKLLDTLEVGLEKHGLGHVVAAHGDEMLASMRQLRHALDGGDDHVLLTAPLGDQLPSLATFQELTWEQMDVLSACGRFADLCSWIKRMGFEGPGAAAFTAQVGLVTNSMSGDRFQEELLVALLHAVPRMSVFMCPSSVTGLVRAIQAVPDFSPTLLHLVADHLTSIQEWFDDTSAKNDAGESWALLEAVLDTGCARLLPRGGDACAYDLEVTYARRRGLDAPVATRTMTWSALHDLHRTVIFHSNGTPDQQGRLAHLSRVLTLCEDWAAVAEALATEVDLVVAQDVWSFVKEEEEVHAATVAALWLQLEEARNTLKNLRVRYPHLSCLTLAQTLHAAGVLEACGRVRLPAPPADQGASGTAASIAVPAPKRAPAGEAQSHLSTLLSYCGIVGCGDTLVRPAGHSRDAATQAAVPEPWPDRYPAALAMSRVGAWLQAAANSGVTCSSRRVLASQGAEPVAACETVAAVFAATCPHGGTALDVYNSLLYLFGGRAPHWSQVLWCDPGTTASAVSMFFERVEAFPGCLHVCVAPHAAASAVLQEISGLVARLVDLRVPCRLVVLFTADCVLARQIVDVLPLSGLPHPHVWASSVQVGQLSAVAGWVFTGAAGAGKSHALAAKTSATPVERGTTITVVAVEDFDAKDVARRLAAALARVAHDNSCLRLVLQVSAYAPFAAVDRVLFFLLVCGAVPDDTAMAHLPKFCRLEVVVEVPAPVGTHDSVACRSSVPSRARRGAPHTAPLYVEGTAGLCAHVAPSAGPSGRKSAGCPCVSCVARVDFGRICDETQGCLHLLPSLAVAAASGWVQVVHVASGAGFAGFQPPDSQQAGLRMLRAFVTPLRDLRRCVHPSSATKFMVVSPCQAGRCPPRFVVDTLAWPQDRGGSPHVLCRQVTASGPLGAGALPNPFDDVDLEVSFQVRSLDVGPQGTGPARYTVQDLLDMLARHVAVEDMAIITASNRSLTTFLAYMTRAANFWDSCIPLKRNQFHLHRGSTICGALISRAVDLCNPVLRADWGAFPHQFFVFHDGGMNLLTTRRVEGVAGGSRRHDRGTIIPCFSDADMPQEDLTIVHDAHVYMRATSASSGPAGALELRRHLARGLQVSLATLDAVLEEQAYVLTLDCALKLLHIAERHHARVPTILEGETGVGKTKLVSVYAAIQSGGMRAALQPWSALGPLVGYVTKPMSAHFAAAIRAQTSIPWSALEGRAVFQKLLALYDDMLAQNPQQLVAFVQALLQALLDGFVTRPTFNVFQCAAVSRAVLRDPGFPDHAAVAEMEVCMGKLWTQEAARGAYAPSAEDAIKVLAECVEVARGLASAQVWAKCNSSVKDITDDGQAQWVLKGKQAFARMVLAFMCTAPAPSFFPISVHAAYTNRDLVRDLEPVVKLAGRASAAVHGGLSLLALMDAVLPPGPPPCYVVFFDEVNTAAILGTLAAVVVDGHLDGAALPHNIFWVCATNPHVGKAQGAVRRLQPMCPRDGDGLRDRVLEDISAFRRRAGADGGPMPSALSGFSATYQVRPVPPAMEEVKWHVGPLRSDGVHEYIELKMKQGVPFARGGSTGESGAHADGPFPGPAEDAAARGGVLSQVTDLFWMAHVYVDCVQGDGAVSQRDIHRVFKAYAFFGDHLRRRRVATDGRTLALWAAHLAVGLVYYLRLGDVDRAGLSEMAAAKVRDARCPTIAAAVSAECDAYLDNMALGPGVARTRSLKENVFAMVACLQIRAPLIIVGPPGCSKTLSYQLVTQAVLTDVNVRDPDAFFGGFASVETGVFHYQCSELSTSLEVKTVFERALARQQAWEEASDASKPFRRTAMVFMDEAGLPHEEKESLKVLHYYLEDARVGFVAISNRPLDAAKSNRAVVVFRSASDAQELAALFVGALAESQDLVRAPFVQAACAAYAELMDQAAPLGSPVHPAATPSPGRLVFRDRYGLRDFYSFGRYLGRRSRAMPPTDLDFLWGLERNFGGLPQPELDAVVRCFFRHWSDGDDVRAAARLARLPRRSALQVLTDAVSEPPPDPARLNETIVRYQLLLDCTADDSGVRLLVQSGVINWADTMLCYLGPFPGDASDEVRSETVSRIKTAMAHGGTVLLMHTGPIHGSLYDVLNQHFTRMESRSGVSYFAMVAVGAVSRPYLVHPRFRLLVHMHAATQAPVPFLSRFEKVLLSPASTYHDLLRGDGVSETCRLVVEAAVGAGNHLATAVLTGAVVGYHPTDTVLGAVLSYFEAQKRKWQASCAPSGGADAPAFAADDVDWDGLGSWVRDVILDLAHPTAVWKSRAALPASAVSDFINDARGRFSLGGLLAGDPGAASWCGALRKTCAFALQERRVPSATPPGGGGAGLPAVLHLASVARFADLEAYVQEWVACGPAAPSLVIVADLRAVDASCVNAARQVLDLAASGAPGTPKGPAGPRPQHADKHAVVLLLLPPTWRLLGPPCYAVPLNGWRFAYLDGLALRGEAVPASAWLQVAAGVAPALRCPDVSLSCLDARVLEHVALTVSGSRTARAATCCRGYLSSRSSAVPDAMEAVYMEPSSRLVSHADRVAALRSLAGVMGGTSLASLLAAEFLASLSQDAVVGGLDAAVAACDTGSSPLSLTMELNEGLGDAYDQFATRLYAHAATGYNLQSLHTAFSLAAAGDGALVQALLAYTKAALLDFCLPCVGGTVQQCSPCVTVAHPARWDPPALPFFALLCREAAAAWSKAKRSGTEAATEIAAAFSLACPTLLSPGGDGFPLPYSAIARRLLEQTLAEVFVGGDASLRTPVKAASDSAVARFVAAHLTHCVPGGDTLCGAFEFYLGSGGVTLRSQAAAVARLELVHALSAEDIDTAVSAALDAQPASRPMAHLFADRLAAALVDGTWDGLAAAASGGDLSPWQVILQDVLALVGDAALARARGRALAAASHLLNLAVVGVGAAAALQAAMPLFLQAAADDAEPGAMLRACLVLVQDKDGVWDAFGPDAASVATDLLVHHVTRAVRDLQRGFSQGAATALLGAFVDSGVASLTVPLCVRVCKALLGAAGSEAKPQLFAAVDAALGAHAAACAGHPQGGCTAGTQCAYVPEFMAAAVEGTVPRVQRLACLQTTIGSAVFEALRAQEAPPGRHRVSEYGIALWDGRFAPGPDGAAVARSCTAVLRDTVAEFALLDCMVLDLLPGPDMGAHIALAPPAGGAVLAMRHVLRYGAARLYLMARLESAYGRAHCLTVLKSSLLEGLFPAGAVDTYGVHYGGESWRANTTLAPQELISVDYSARLPVMWPASALSGTVDLGEGLQDQAQAYRAFEARTLEAFRARSPPVYRTWLAWLRAEYGASPQGCRAASRFLFCVVAWHYFDRDADRRCEGYLDTADRLAEVLDFTDRHKRLMAAFADPENVGAPHAGDVGRVFFSKTSSSEGAGAVESDKRMRAFIMGMVAAVLGCGPSHPLAAYLFSPGDIEATVGICSRYRTPIGGVHYDCGTQFDPARPGAVTAAQDWGAYYSLLAATHGLIALGLVLYPDQLEACYGPVFSRFYDREPVRDLEAGRAAGARSTSRDEWLVNFVFGRVVASWAVLCNFVTLSPEELSVDLLWAAERYCHVVQAAAGEPGCVARCVTAGQADAFERLWMLRCYGDARDKAAAIRAVFSTSLSRSSVGNTIAQLRRELAPRPALMHTLGVEVQAVPSSGHGWLLTLRSATATFASLAMVPDLVALYALMHDALAHQVTQDEAAVLTVSQAASRLPAGIAAAMVDLYRAVVPAWNALHAQLEGLLAVGACENGQRFDAIGDHTAVGTFLTYPDNETNDVLLRVVDFLIQVQNSFLLSLPQWCKAGPGLADPASLTSAHMLQPLDDALADAVHTYSSHGAEKGACLNLNAIARAMAPLVRKPLIESTSVSLVRRFQFRAPVADVDMTQTEALTLQAGLLSDLHACQQFVDALAAVGLCAETLAQEGVHGGALPPAVGAALLKRMATLSPAGQEVARRFLLALLSLVVQYVESSRSACRRLHAGQAWQDRNAMSAAIAADVSRRVRLYLELPACVTVQQLAGREGLALGALEPEDAAVVAATLCDRPVLQAPGLIRLLGTRRVQHGDQFARFPPFMRTPLPEDAVATLEANMAAEFGEDVSVHIKALAALQALLEDRELEADVSQAPALDEHSMVTVLVSYVRLEVDGDPIHAAWSRIIPPSIRGRCHYCELLQYVFCRLVYLRVQLLS